MEQVYTYMPTYPALPLPFTTSYSYAHSLLPLASSSLLPITCDPYTGTSLLASPPMYAVATTTMEHLPNTMEHLPNHMVEHLNNPMEHLNNTMEHHPNIMGHHPNTMEHLPNTMDHLPNHMVEHLPITMAEHLPTTMEQSAHSGYSFAPCTSSPHSSSPHSISALLQASTRRTDAKMRSTGGT